MHVCPELWSRGKYEGRETGAGKSYENIWQRWKTFILASRDIIAMAESHLGRRAYLEFLLVIACLSFRPCLLWLYMTWFYIQRRGWSGIVQMYLLLHEHHFSLAVSEQGCAGKLFDIFFLCEDLRDPEEWQRVAQAGEGRAEKKEENHPISGERALRRKKSVGTQCQTQKPPCWPETSSLE